MRRCLLLFTAFLLLAAAGAAIAGGLLIAPTTSSGAITFVRSAASGNCVSATTCTVMMNRSGGSGNFIVIGTSIWDTSSTSTAVSSVTIDFGSGPVTCTLEPNTNGAFVFTVTTLLAVDIRGCQNVPTGNATVVVTLNTAPNQVFDFTVAEFSGVKTSGASAGLGFARQQATGTSLNTAPSAGLTQNNQLAFSLIVHDGAGITTTKPASTIATVSTCGACSYQVVNTSGSTGPYTYNLAGGSVNIVGAIGVFNHP